MSENDRPLAANVAALVTGLEAALLALIAALDKTGALPIAEARSALDGAYAVLSDAQKRSGTGTVLRQLAERLAPPATSQ